MEANSLLNWEVRQRCFASTLILARLLAVLFEMIPLQTGLEYMLPSRRGLPGVESDDAESSESEDDPNCDVYAACAGGRKSKDTDIREPREQEVWWILRLFSECPLAVPFWFNQQGQHRKPSQGL